MAAEKPIGEFSLKATTFTFTPGPGGSVLVHLNCEGTGTGFGTVLGTLSVLSASQPSGRGAGTRPRTWTMATPSLTPARGPSEMGRLEFVGLATRAWRLGFVGRMAASLDDPSLFALRLLYSLAFSCSEAMLRSHP